MGKEVTKPTGAFMFNLGDDIPATTKEVEVYDKEHVTLAITFIETQYQLNNGKLPKFEDFRFLEAFGYGTKKRITKLLNSEDIYIGLSRRGIAWPRPYNPDRTDALVVLSPQQQHCVLCVTDPTRTDSLRKRLELVGIGYQTYRNWMKQPAFGNAIRALSEDVLQDNLASVHTSMTAKAMAGDVTAARLVYELSGRHDPGKQQMLDLSRIIGLLLESLTRHITDPLILERLGNDLDIIIAGDTPQISGPTPDFSFVEQIVDAVIVPDDAAQNPAQENSDGTAESDVPERSETEAKSRNNDNVPLGFFDV